MSNRFEILGVRYKMDDPTMLLVIGWFTENQCGDMQLLFQADGEELPYEIKEKKSMNVARKVLSSQRVIDTEYFYWIKLPKDFSKKKEFTISRVGKKKIHKIIEVKIDTIAGRNKSILGNIDFAGIENDVAVIRGWFVRTGESDIKVYNLSGKMLEAEIKQLMRQDVLFEFPEISQENVIGYEIKLPNIQEKTVQLVIRCDGKKYTKKCRMAYGKIETLFIKSRKALVKGVAYTKNNGIKRTIKRSYEKIFENDVKKYSKWRKRQIPSQEELDRQKKEKFAYTPKISIVVPLYKTPEKYLGELIESVLVQTYKNWELCFSDGSGEETSLRQVVKAYQKKDDRIKIVYSDKPLQISENTNAALKIATGEFVAFADHDDL